MSFNGSMHVSHVKADNELELEKKIRRLELEHDGMIKVINIYRGGTGVVAWYYHDIKRAGMPKQEETKQNKTKKKTTKKSKSK